MPPESCEENDTSSHISTGTTVDPPPAYILVSAGIDCLSIPGAETRVADN